MFCLVPLEVTSLALGVWLQCPGPASSWKEHPCCGMLVGTQGQIGPRPQASGENVCKGSSNEL